MQRFAARMLGTEFQDGGRSPAGLDCWGLVLLAYQEVFGVAVPDPEVSAMDSRTAAAHFLAQSQLWQEVPRGRERLGDVVLFRIGRWVAHAGLVLQPGLMLHTRIDLPTCVEHYDVGIWKSRLSGIYRHAELAGNH